MRKTSLIAVAVAMTASAPAFAQDGQSEYFDGFYIGGTISADQPEDSNTDGIVFDTNGDGVFNDTVRSTTGADAFSPGFCNGAAVGATAGQGCVDDEADFGYSARIGYDQRLNGGPIVVGLLVEGARSEATEFSNGFSTTPASYTVVRQMDWSVNARGRVGYSPGDGRGLFYVTGGVGYAKIDHGFVTTNGANAFTQQNDDDWQFGAQVGGGAELMLTRNIGIGLEYLYSDYNDDDYSVLVTQGTAPATLPRPTGTCGCTRCAPPRASTSRPTGASRPRAKSKKGRSREGSGPFAMPARNPRGWAAAGGWKGLTHLTQCPGTETGLTKIARLIERIDQRAGQANPPERDDDKERARSRPGNSGARGSRKISE